MKSFFGASSSVYVVAINSHENSCLSIPQSKLAHSSEELESMTKVVAGLETQLGDVKLQLEEERRNCRLLMDYPFVKQSSDGYAD